MVTVCKNIAMTAIAALGKVGKSNIVWIIRKYKNAESIMKNSCHFKDNLVFKFKTTGIFKIAELPLKLSTLLEKCVFT